MTELAYATDKPAAKQANIRRDLGNANTRVDRVVLFLAIMMKTPVVPHSA
jgi:hypothetical protein